MKSPALRGLLIIAGAFLLCFSVFAIRGVPIAEGVRIDETIFATLLAGIYTFSALAAVLFSRGVLGVFFDFSRPIAFFRALAGVTDPLIALFAPVTPNFLHPAFHPFHAAFCLYALRLLIFPFDNEELIRVAILLSSG